jgi:hypothetical protein
MVTDIRLCSASDLDALNERAVFAKLHTPQPEQTLRANLHETRAGGRATGVAAMKRKEAGAHTNRLSEVVPCVNQHRPRFSVYGQRETTRGQSYFQEPCGSMHYSAPNNYPTQPRVRLQPPDFFRGTSPKTNLQKLCQVITTRPEKDIISG